SPESRPRQAVTGCLTPRLGHRERGGHLSDETPISKLGRNEVFGTSICLDKRSRGVRHLDSAIASVEGISQPRLQSRSSDVTRCLAPQSRISISAPRLRCPVTRT